MTPWPARSCRTCPTAPSGPSGPGSPRPSRLPSRCGRCRSCAHRGGSPRPTAPTPIRTAPVCWPKAPCSGCIRPVGHRRSGSPAKGSTATATTRRPNRSRLRSCTWCCRSTSAPAGSGRNTTSSTAASNCPTPATASPHAGLDGGLCGGSRPPPSQGGGGPGSLVSPPAARPRFPAPPGPQRPRRWACSGGAPTSSSQRRRPSSSRRRSPGRSPLRSRDSDASSSTLPQGPRTQSTG